MWPNPQETADLATFTEKIFKMENFIFRAVRVNKIRSKVQEKSMLREGVSNFDQC